MRIIYSDPNAPQPERQPSATPTQRPINWRRLWLGLAITHLDALARDPKHPYRHQFHEGDGAAILALRDRYEAGAWAGPDDRGDADALALPPTTPPPPIADPPARTCRDCGDVIGPHGDRCVRCAGLTPARPQRVCELCAGVIGPDVAGDICPRCSAQMGGGDPGDEWMW